MAAKTRSKSGGARSGAKKRSPARPKATGKSPSDALTANAAIVKALKSADGPMHVKQIAEKVAKMKTRLNGKTPEATIAANLHVSAKKGVLFKKTGPGMFDLLERSGRGTREVEPDPKPSA